MYKFIVLFSLNLNVPMRVNVANINYFYPKNNGSVVVMQNGEFFDTRESPQVIDNMIFVTNRLKLEDIDRIWSGYPEMGSMSQMVKSSDYALMFFPKLVKLAKAAKKAIMLSKEVGEFFQGMTDIESALIELEGGLMAQQETGVF